MSKFIQLISEKTYPHSGIGRWMKEKWKDQYGKTCGSGEAHKRGKYPKCRPSKRVSKKTPETWGEMSKGEKTKAVRRKQKVRGGVSSHMNEETENVPTNPELWSSVKASLSGEKHSAYKMARASRIYKKRGGGWRKKKVDEKVQSPEWALYHKSTGKFIKSEDPESGELTPATYASKSEAMQDFKSSYGSIPELQVTRYNAKMERKGIKEETTRTHDDAYEEEKKRKKKRERQNRRKSVSVKSKSNLKEKLNLFYSNLIEKINESTDKDSMPCNKPTASNRPGKKKMVKACEGGKEKIVHFGAKGYGHNYSPAARKSFRARHKCGEKKSKLSAQYWACKNLWAGPKGSKASCPEGRKCKYESTEKPISMLIIEEIVNKDHKGKMTKKMKRSRDACAKKDLPGIVPIKGNDTKENAKHRYCTSLEWKKQK